MKTKLKPYKLDNYSPHSSPVRVGELAITLDEPRGYCVIVRQVLNDVKKAAVQFLDSPNGLRMFDLNSLIPTRLKPTQFFRGEKYFPTPMQIDDALDAERDFPDFDKLKKRKSPSKKKEKKMKQTEQDEIMSLLKQKLSELGMKIKEA